jgi:hypothetical protein
VVQFIYTAVLEHLHGKWVDVMAKRLEHFAVLLQTLFDFGTFEGVQVAYNPLEICFDEMRIWIKSTTRTKQIELRPFFIRFDHLPLNEHCTFNFKILKVRIIILFDIF